MAWNCQPKRGYVALIAVLTISVVILVVTITVTTLSINSAQSALEISHGEQTLALVEGCAEDGLLKAEQNSSYAGGTDSRPEGTCNIAVTKNGSLWTMTISNPNTDANTATAQVVFNLNGTAVNMISWNQE
jgi:hypothetical protein